MPAELETVDLDGVEILGVGGPIHAIGSPPEGDNYTTDDLRAMAAAAADLGDQLRAPAKIGHWGGSMPAVGWLENQRVSDDGSKLLADIKQVPATFKSLLDVGAYRTRSAELSRATNQKTGKVHDYVVSGLAWLGGQRPSVQTLGDVVKLYEADDAERRAFVIYEGAEPSVKQLQDALTGLETDMVKLQAAVSKGRADTRPMPDTKFTKEQRRAFSEATGLEEEKVTDEMLAKAGIAEETTAPAISDEKARELAEALGVKFDNDEDFEPAKLLEAAKAKAEKPEQRTIEQEEIVRRLETAEKNVKSAADEAKRANEELRLERRRSFVHDVLKEGKAKPAQQTEIEKMYDLDPDAVSRYFENAPIDFDLVREFGSDSEEITEETEKAQKAHEEDLAGRLGVKAEELL
jgi:hypothetical protein